MGASFEARDIRPEVSGDLLRGAAQKGAATTALVLVRLSEVHHLPSEGSDAESLPSQRRGPCCRRRWTRCAERQRVGHARQEQARRRAHDDRHGAQPHRRRAAVEHERGDVHDARGRGGLKSSASNPLTVAARTLSLSSDSAP